MDRALHVSQWFSILHSYKTFDLEKCKGHTLIYNFFEIVPISTVVKVCGSSMEARAAQWNLTWEIHKSESSIIGGGTT